MAVVLVSVPIVDTLPGLESEVGARLISNGDTWFVSNGGFVGGLAVL